MTKRMVLIGSMTLLLGATLPAAIDGAAAPAALADVFNCQSMGDERARLACYDRTVASLKLAYGKKDVVVADRATIREARRGLFGLTLPKIRLFESGGEEEISSLDSTVSAVGTTGAGGLLLTLEGGARWQQVDKEFVNTPKPGAKINIRRGALGNYMAKVGGGRAFKVRRVGD